MKILLQKSDRIEITQKCKLVDKKTKSYSRNFTCTVMEKVDFQVYKTVLKNIEAISFFENALNLSHNGACNFVSFAMLQEDMFNDGACNNITVNEVKKDGVPVFEIYGELFTADEALEEHDNRTGCTIGK